eukprot:TRINITY_DN8660_c0_g2_i2.p1 TRINITY_DN8660_c0_g2~~TRINITY_DN8660_c0_g2_i2.p1  ORF type:complete len:328 (+),score=-2.27 TRINITY_DN8660_c0_g2_i2:700-1683(+)
MSFFSHYSFLLLQLQTELSTGRLSDTVLGNKNIARTAAILYCLTPANIFMSAIYTESLFAYLFLGGLRMHAQNRNWVASVKFGLACFVRSNGVLACWFFAYTTFIQCPLAVLVPGNLRSRERLPRAYPTRACTWSLYLHIVMSRAMQCLVVLLPLVFYLLYGYHQYCTNEDTRRLSPWCDSVVPNIYSFVQSQYWNVGFLRYWQFKQLPNFALATPMILLSSFGLYTYFWPRRPTSVSFHAPRLFPYMAYWGIQLLVALFTMHVQVTTRFVSSCPAIYWFAAHLFHTTTPVLPSTTSNRWLQSTILFYFLCYSLIGPVLFANFYPWT